MSPIERPARFILRSENGEILREYVLDKPQVTIGRASNRDLSLSQDKLISRRHLVISYERGSYILLDEGSANGTYVNGILIEAMHPHVLNNDDLITLGHHQLIFQRNSAIAIEDLPTVNMPLDEVLKADLELRLKQERHQDIRQEQPLPQSLVGVSLPAPDVSTIARFQSVDPMNSTSVGQLRFTLYSPGTFTVDEWGALLVYAHLEQASARVQRDATNFIQGLDDVPLRPLSPDNPLLNQKVSITVIPECQGISFNPKRSTFAWSAEWHRAEFRFSIKPEDPITEKHGIISVFAGPLLLATLPIKIAVESPGKSANQYSIDWQASVPAYKRIFTSYSQDDVTTMTACRSALRTFGLTEMARIDPLRPTRSAASALQHLIDASEVFELFWSEHAARTGYVTKEWEYALALGREGKFLRPVYWGVPLNVPPDPLRALHFTYLPRYTFTPRR